MPELLPVADNLKNILTDIWGYWDQGSANRRSPFHTPVVASIDLTGMPAQRVMVLRKADHDAGSLRFHTDVRSGKTAQLTMNQATSVTGYDAGSKVQLRATGIASIVSSGPAADAAWAMISLSGRRSYLTMLAPGCVSDQATSGLPPLFDSSSPTLEDSDAGRANFAIITVAVDRMEWLHLAATGHRRAAFIRHAQGWTGTWLVP